MELVFYFFCSATSDERREKFNMRKALIVGIDYYNNVAPLYGCSTDACAVDSVLSTNGDGTKNFDTKLCIATDQYSIISRKELKNNIEELFKDNCEISLFYFSGHGYIESTGGYLITSDCSEGDDGLPMSDLLNIANASPARNKIIVLDCCHSGIMGNPSYLDASILKEGMTILTASSAEQYALEEEGSGVFTKLFVNALNGSAANLLGDITPGSIYAHIDQSLGLWEQRPIFKTNIRQFTVLRRMFPSISLADLKKIVELFPMKDQDFKLDPSFEPQSTNPNEENMKKFEILQKYNRINLVVPVDSKHMYFAAMEEKSCRLTVLGKHYWNLVKKHRI